MVFTAGIGLGLAMGLVVGVVLGNWWLRETTRTMNAAIEKATFAVAYPHPDVEPAPAPEPLTVHAFDSQETDEERVPDWMDEDYPMAGMPIGESG